MNSRKSDKMVLVVEGAWTCIGLAFHPQWDGGGGGGGGE